MLIIDGTLREPLARAQFGEFDKITTIRAKRNVRVVQVVGSKFSMGMLKKAHRRKDFTYKTVTAERKRVEAVITEKKFKELLGWGDDPLAMHFRNLRGRNDIEHCDSVLVLGYCQPPTPPMVAIAEALSGEKIEGENFVQTDYITDSKGNRYKTEFHNHTNALVQELIEANREDELEQAIDRLRLVHHQGALKLVLLWSPVVLPIDVDEVLLWDDIRADRYDATFEQLLTSGEGKWAGVIPEAPTSAHIYRSDVFNSEKTARNHYKKWPDNWKDGLERVEIEPRNGNQKAKFGYRRQTPPANLYLTL